MTRMPPRMTPFPTLNEDDLRRTADAVCYRSDPEAWFVDTGDREAVARVKSICAECPVRTACLEIALRTDEPHGIWGGMTPAERQRMKGAAA